MQSLFAALGNYIQENDGAYQLFYSSILWEKGDEKNVRTDLTRIRTIGDEIVYTPNNYFRTSIKYSAFQYKFGSERSYRSGS